jgi:hypothetical protein
MEWYDAPADQALPVLKELPAGAQATETEASLLDGDKVLFWHKCQYCDGWIPGMAFEAQENTLGPMSGREGIVYYCLRCGNEIGFSGVQS